MDNIENIGFDDWFMERIDMNEIAPYQVARVMAVHKDRYHLSDGSKDAYAELSGHLFYSTDSPVDLPTTGDWVIADFYQEGHAIIHGIIPRKSLLKRKTAGKRVEFQLIAANIDTAFIMQSVDYNLNLRRLERYLALVYESGITAIVLLSKTDLISSAELEDIVKRVEAIAPEVKIIAYSSITGANTDRIKTILLPAQTYCLLGSSGVGKTSLINYITDKQSLATQTVSKKENKGRHTTTRRELLQLGNGALLMDTPGMRELGNMSIEDGIDETFSDILALSQNCKYSDCSHAVERGCAILDAIDNKTLSEARYRNYLKLKKESEFNEMSYLEKKNKDKDLGKLIKTVMKNKKRR